MSDVAPTSRGRWTPADTPPARRSSVSIVPGVILIVAELVLAWVTVDILRWLGDHESLLGDSLRLFGWLVIVLPFLPLAFVAPLTARTPTRALAAVLAAVAAGATAVGFYELINFLFLHGHAGNFRVIQTLGYVDEMTIASLATLAWGFSRREGRGWPLGVAVAALGAALSLWTDWQNNVGWASYSNAFTATDVRRGDLLHAVAVMLPIVVGCLVSWYVERRELGPAAGPQAS